MLSESVYFHACTDIFGPQLKAAGDWLKPGAHHHAGGLALLDAFVNDGGYVTASPAADAAATGSDSSSSSASSSSSSSSSSPSLSALVALGVDALSAHVRTVLEAQRFMAQVRIISFFTPAPLSVYFIHIRVFAFFMSLHHICVFLCVSLVLPLLFQLLLFQLHLIFYLTFQLLSLPPPQSLIDRLPAADRAAWHRAIRACIALLLKQHAGLARRVFRSFAVDEWMLRAQQQVCSECI